MKNKKIDNLFRNKLARHEVAPSADAWAKLEGKMTTKKSGYLVYWRVAAVLILLITSVFALYDFDDRETTIAITEEINPKEDEVKDVEDIIINNDSKTQLADTAYVIKEEEKVIADFPKQNIKRKVTPTVAPRQTKKRQVVDFTTQKKQTELVADNGAEKEDVIKLIDKVEDNKVVATIENTQTPKNKSYDFNPKVVITFKKGKEEEKEAIANIKDNKNKKNKLLRRVLNFAKEVNSKNIGLASIREAKDDIFTFQSKKQNKKVNPK